MRSLVEIDSVLWMWTSELVNGLGHKFCEEWLRELKKGRLRGVLIALTAI